MGRDWDRLTRLVADAWTWRDLESLDLLADCLRGLRAKVLEEWGE